MNQRLSYRLFESHDAHEVSSLIRRNFREVNAKDYSEATISSYIDRFTSEYIEERALHSNFYVFHFDRNLIGCGAIARYFGKSDESILLTIFVNPDYQGQGIGSEIIHVLEKDELFVNAKRIEVPASITALNFYKKLGYDFKDGNMELDEESNYRLEKFNTI